MLTEAGYEVIEAESGAAALALVKTGVAFDALISDFAMPMMTGLEVAEEIRSVRAGTPVLLITGFASTPETESAGILRLAKPFRQMELNTAVANLLDRNRAG